MTTHSSLDEANAFLLGGGVPSAKFETIGTVVSGEVRDAAMREQTDIKTGEVKTWDNGDPRMQLVITLDTGEIDPDIEDDEGLRRLFAKGNMLNAIRKAVGREGIAIGGTLAVKYTGDGEASKRGFNPPKLYAARYTPPLRTVDIGGTADDEEWDAGSGAVAPSQPPAAAKPAARGNGAAKPPFKERVNAEWRDAKDPLPEFPTPDDQVAAAKMVGNFWKEAKEAGFTREQVFEMAGLDLKTGTLAGYSEEELIGLRGLLGMEVADVGAPFRH